MVVRVSSVNWDVSTSRRAEVSLEDEAGVTVPLVDYAGAEQSVTWQRDHYYRITDCNVKAGTAENSIYLAPSKQTTIEPLGPRNEDTSILIVGDTHIGRTEHPDTGVKIDPIGAFRQAIEYGLTQGVVAVVHVGDIYHESATTSQVETVDDCVFDPLDEAGVPFYFVRGNHQTDEGDSHLASRRLVRNLDTDGVAVESRIRIFGINHDPDGDIPLASLPVPASVSEPLSMLVLHQTLRQLSGPGKQHVDLRDVEGDSNSQFDCVISGHHHDATIETWNGSPVLYTGASEEMSSIPDSADRVGWLVTITDESATIERYDIP
jgi:DNA repair exonuclease SbcCD nuclease subunit